MAEASQLRVAQSQREDYNGTGGHMTLAPSDWYYKRQNMRLGYDGGVIVVLFLGIEHSVAAHELGNWVAKAVERRMMN